MRAGAAGIVAAVAFGTAALLAQGRPAFEVASIRASADQPDRASLGIHVDGAQIHIAYLSLKQYVARAYGVLPSQVAGPGWMDGARFDVAAKLPDGTAPVQVPEMLQSLLATRFELNIHHESRELPVYAILVTAGGARLTPAPADDTDVPAPAGSLNITATGSASGVNVDLGGGSFFALANNRLEIHKVSMPQLATVLGRFLDREAVDATNLSGSYNLMIDLTPEDYQAALLRAAVNSGVVLPPEALRMLDTLSTDPFSSQLRKVGLTLESRKAPFDFIVVDSMRKTPTDN